MKKLIFTYGGISGAIVIGIAIISSAASSGGGSAGLHLAALEWLGYLVMLIALSMIFVAIKRYRDQELGGVIKFGTACALGLGIAVVAGIVYVVAWEVYLAASDYAFINTYIDSVISNRQAAGASAADIQALTLEMENMRQQYSNPFYRLPLTFMEIFPVGFLITLISAAILRNSRVLPAAG